MLLFSKIFFMRGVLKILFLFCIIIFTWISYTYSEYSNYHELSDDYKNIVDDSIEKIYKSVESWTSIYKWSKSIDKIYYKMLDDDSWYPEEVLNKFLIIREIKAKVDILKRQLYWFELSIEQDWNIIDIDNWVYKLKKRPFNIVIDHMTDAWFYLNTSFDDTFYNKSISWEDLWLNIYEAWYPFGIWKSWAEEKYNKDKTLFIDKNWNQLLTYETYNIYSRNGDYSVWKKSIDNILIASDDFSTPSIEKSISYIDSDLYLVLVSTFYIWWEMVEINREAIKLEFVDE